ncbi:MAG: hypothetical protein ACYSWW_10440 [Planctomycetota bacterium]|jgi:hypothetical protein
MNPKYAKAYRHRAAAYSMAGEYEKAWRDVYKAHNLGYPIQPEFLSALRVLREASSSEK